MSSYNLLFHCTTNEMYSYFMKAALLNPACPDWFACDNLSSKTNKLHKQIIFRSDPVVCYKLGQNFNYFNELKESHNTDLIGVLKLFC